MFDVGFGELLLVSVIGLVVIGPERLPATIRTIAGWIKTLRSLAANVQNELSQELKLQALQDSLTKAEQAGLQNLTPALKRSISELKEAAQGVTPLSNSHLVGDGSDNEEHHSLPDVPSILQTDPVQPESAIKSCDALLPEDKIPARSTMKDEKVALNPVPVFKKAYVSDKSNDDC